jgi:sortase A
VTASRTAGTRTTRATGGAAGQFTSEPRSGWGRAVAQAVGDLLVTAGLVVLLFLGYQLFYSNLDANRAQERVTAELERRWAAPAPRAQAAAKPAPGVGFARVHIPRLGRGWARPIVEGVGPQDLTKGVGHYPTTALPGGIGNFALAGHRATHGEPFRNLDRLRPGDAVVIETRDTWYVYTADVTRIVLPTQVDVVAPVPDRPGVRPTQRLLTLSTCHPRWASYQRLIIHGELTDVVRKSAGTPDALQNA